MIIVKIPPKLIICCYYRSNISLPNISKINDILDSVMSKYPGCKLLLLGDLNLPGIDWKTHSVKTGAQYKSIHHEFINTLHSNNLHQLIHEPTHVHGNILDLVCINDPTIIRSTNVIIPGLSDHYIVTTEIDIETIAQPSNSHKASKHEIRIHRKANVDVFRECMDDTRNKLGTMKDTQEMWTLFTTTFRESINKSVPTETVKTHRHDKPVWFSKHAENIIQKQRRTYNKFKATADPYYLAKHKQQRRSNKKELKQIKKKVCSRQGLQTPRKRK